MSRSSFSFIENMLLLRQSALFEGLSPSELRQVSALCRNFHCDAGEYIIRQGDQQEQFYIIADGEVELHLGDGENYVLYESRVQGAVLGEGSLFLSSYNAPFTVRAKVDTTLLAIAREQLLDLLHESPTISLKFVAYYAEKQDAHERELRKIVQRKIEMYSL